MTERIPPFIAIEAFVATASVSSLTTAAKILHVTPSAISRRIRSLEENLGVKLLLRNPRTVQLTDIGAQYYNNLIPAFEILQSATKNIRSMTAAAPLRVSAPPAFAANWLIPRLISFETNHPNIDVLIATQSPGISTGYSVAGEIDITIKFACKIDMNKNEQELMSILLFPVCSNCLYDKKINAKDLNLTLKVNKLLGVASYPNLWNAIITNLTDSPSDCFTYIMYDDFFVMYESAMRGVGIAVGVDVLVDNYLKQDRITRLSSVPVSSGLKLIISQDTPASKPASLFLSWIYKETKEWSDSRNYI